MKSQGVENLLIFYPFEVPGTTNPAREDFRRSWLIALGWSNEKKAEQLKKQKGQFRTKKKLMVDVLAILNELFDDRISMDECVRLIRDTKIDDDTLKSVFKNVEELEKATPEELAARKAALELDGKRIAREEKILKLEEKASEPINGLLNMALQDDTQALKSLLSLANRIVGAIQIASNTKPELMRPMARQALMWPVMANIDPQWKLDATALLRKIELGEDTIHGRLESTKAYRLEGTTRRYARAIVDTLEFNRKVVPWLCETFLVAKEKVLSRPTRYMLFTAPDWAKEAVLLPPFSKSSAKEWLRVGISMLKEQVPDLPHHRDWQSIKMALSRREQATDGRLWNEIKDSLASPINTIARKEPVQLPKKR